MVNGPISLELARIIPWHPEHIGDCVQPNGDYYRFGVSMRPPIIQKGGKHEPRWYFEKGSSFSKICLVEDFGDWEKTLNMRSKEVYNGN
jgi:hypothetical protein